MVNPFRSLVPHRASSSSGWNTAVLTATLTLSALSIGAVWELFWGGAHKQHLLAWLLGAFALTLSLIAIEHFSNRDRIAESLLSHERLRTALVSGKSVAWDLDVRTGRNTWFGDLETLFGIPSESSTVELGTFYRYVYPDDRERVSRAVEEARDKRKPYSAEFRMVHETGTVRWVKASGKFHYGRRGEPVRMLGLAIDITESKSAHEALIKSAEKFAKAFHAGPVTMTLTSARDHRYLDVNETFEQITGWKRDEVIGRTPFDINIWVDPTERERIAKLIHEQKNVRNFEVHFRCKNGSQGVGLASAEFIEIEGEPLILSAIVDITDRKRAEDRLRHKESELANAQRLAHIGSWDWDLDSGVIRWSEELYRIYGLDPSQPAPAFEDLPKMYTPETWSRLRQAMEENFLPDMDMELIRPDGSERWIHTTFDVTRDKSGMITQLRGVSQDITEEKQTRDQLRESQERMNAIVNSAMDAIVTIDEEQQIVLFNAAAEQMFQCPMGDAIGTHIDRFIPAPFRTKRAEHLFRFGGAGEAKSAHGDLDKLYALRSTGEGFPIEASISKSENQGQKLFTIIIRDITDRLRAEAVLHESEERFRRVVEHIGDGLLVDDVTGHLLFANDRFLQLFGFSREQAPSLKLEDYVAPEYRAELRDRHDRRVRGEAVPAHFEYEGIRVDGRRIWLEVDVVPIADSEGKIVGTQSAIRDITERKIAAQTLQENEQRLRHLINTSNDWIYEMDRKGVYTYAGPRCRELLGYEPEEMIGKTPLDFMPPDEAALLTGRFRDFLTEPRAFALFKSRRVHKDGHIVVWETNGVPILENNGEFCGYRGTVRDITERENSENALRQSEERFRRVVEHIADALAVDDVAGHIVFANDQFLHLFGFRREELANIMLEDYVAPEYRVEVRDRHDRRMLGEVVDTRFEYEGLRRDGTKLWIDAQVVAIRAADGKLVGTQKILRDVSDWKRTDQALRESEERFRLVANSAPVMIWMSGADQLCNYFNKPWLDFTGRSLQAELGHGWMEGIHPEDSDECLRKYVEAFDKRQVFELEYRLRRYDGEYRWLVDIGVPRFNADGSFSGYIGSCLDITERKRAEEAMSTIGRRLIEAHEEERTWIGRELHDDINQRLALLAVELDRMTEHASEEVGAQVRHAQERITQIAKDVQGLSHRLHSSKLEYLGLAKAAHSFCRELSEQLKVEIHFTHADIPHTLPKDISLCLFRVLQEALQNATKYSGVRDFTVELYGSSGSIELTVTDRGRGFEEHEAFTRSGLGLISMRERLQLVHGELSIKSTPGGGTTIYARVPLPSHEYRSKAG